MKIERAHTLAENLSDHAGYNQTFLPDEVRQADLTTYADKQLEGRRAYYLKQYTFERDRHIREENKIELDRTIIEINRRAMYARAEADRVFEL